MIIYYDIECFEVKLEGARFFQNFTQFNLTVIKSSHSVGLSDYPLGSEKGKILDVKTSKYSGVLEVDDRYEKRLDLNLLRQYCICFHKTEKDLKRLGFDYDRVGNLCFIIICTILTEKFPEYKLYVNKNSPNTFVGFGNDYIYDSDRYSPYLNSGVKLLKTSSETNLI